MSNRVDPKVEKAVLDNMAIIPWSIASKKWAQEARYNRFPRRSKIYVALA